MDLITMNMIANTPTVQSTGIGTMDGQSVSMTAYTPTVFISNVVSSVMSMAWVAIDGGSFVNQTTVITCNPSTCTLTSTPTWIVVADWFYDLINIGDNVTTGDTIRIYPDMVNYGAERTGNVIFTNSYGDTVVIAVTQFAPIVVPNVTVQQDPLDTSGMTLTATSGYNTSGTVDVYITFTPDHPLYTLGQTFDMTWQATKNGGYAGGGIFTAYDETINGDVHITMTVTALISDMIIIYLSGESLT
jgi:hypothetical protein